MRAPQLAYFAALPSYDVQHQLATLRRQLDAGSRSIMARNRRMPFLFGVGVGGGCCVLVLLQLTSSVALVRGRPMSAGAVNEVYARTHARVHTHTHTLSRCCFRLGNAFHSDDDGTPMMTTAL
jgi:hypothetical protein